GRGLEDGHIYLNVFASVITSYHAVGSQIFVLPPWGLRQAIFKKYNRSPTPFYVVWCPPLNPPNNQAPIDTKL
ncbi:hypothetical protein J6590_000480, partial [Homalodisca vitripennis]